MSHCSCAGTGGFASPIRPHKLGSSERWWHLYTAVQQHAFEIAVSDGDHQIPSQSPQHHLGGELTAFKILILPYLGCSLLSGHAAGCTQPDQRGKDATEPRQDSTRHGFHRTNRNPTVSGDLVKVVGCTRRANNGGRHGDRLLPDYVAALACAQQNNANLGLIQLY
jgi:hypothetical protein